MVGLLLQSTVLVFAALVTYWWKWPKTGSFVAPYGYPLTATGTIMLSVGLIMCAWVVEASTDEVVWNRKKDTNNSCLRIMWLQKAEQKNTDTGIRSMAILGSKEKRMKGGLRTIRTSQRNAKTHRTAVYVGVSMALLGYLSQLIGFRTLHSAVPLVQFGATLVMTALRARVRRGLSERPEVIQLSRVPPGHEQDWLSLYVGNCTEWYVLAGFEILNSNMTEENEDSVGQRVMHLRQNIAELSSCQLSTDAAATNLVKAIQDTIKEIQKWDPHPRWNFQFGLPVLVRPRIPKHHHAQPENFAKISNITLQPLDTKLFRNQVRAVLSLWLHGFKKKKLFPAPDIYVVSKAGPESHLFCYKWICLNPTNWLTVSPVKGEYVPEPSSWFPITEEGRTFDPRYSVGDPKVTFSPAPETDVGQSSGRTDSYIVYTFPSHYSTVKIFAQHIFACFIRDNAPVFMPPFGQTEIETDSTRPGPIISNKWMAGLVEIFVKSGLGSAEEGYVCIVSSLAAKGKFYRNLGSNDLSSFGALELLKRNPDNLNLYIGLLDLAKRTNDEILARPILLHERKAKPSVTVLHSAASRGKWELVKWLVEHDADVKAVDNEGRTVLHYAAVLGEWELVKLLVEHGADVESKGNHFGWTPLTLAAMRGRLDVIKFLVKEAGADVESKDSAWERSPGGQTPLSYAAANGRLEAVKFLVEWAGADVQWKDEGGRTALDVVKRATREGWWGGDEEGRRAVVAWLEAFMVKGVGGEPGDSKKRGAKGCKHMISRHRRPPST